MVLGIQASCFDYAINMLILLVSELSWITVSSLFDPPVCFSGLCSGILLVPKYPERMEHTTGLESQDFAVYLCKCVSEGI